MLIDKRDYIGENECMSKLTTPRQPVELSYLAGLIDGEGYVSMTFSNQRSKFPGVSKFRLALVINMVEPQALEWAHRLWGGSLKSYEHKKAPRKKWRSFWRWILEGEDAADVLRDVLPFVRVKNRQIALFFKAIEIKKQARWKRDSHRHNLLCGIVEEMRVLTNRGRKPGAVETVRLAPVNQGGDPVRTA